jgi:adenylate cyclase
MGADEEGTLAALKAIRRELVDLKIAEHRGRTVKTTGDGLLVEFQSVVDAVRCAVEVQRGMAERNADVPTDKRIDFRVGINLGDIIIDDGDIFGDGVNIAARLEALAEPGGICVSRVVRDQVRDKLAFSFADMGEHNVKNIARPVRAYAVTMDAAPSALPAAARAPTDLPRRSIGPRRVAAIAAGLAAVGIGIAIAAWWASPEKSSTTSVQAPAAASAQNSPSVTDAKGTPAASAPLLSIVVVPFANLSNDPEQEYFADAITEDLTTDLSRIADSFVIARSTAFTFKGKSVDVKQIGHDLGVRYVLEGSVRRLGDQVQVNVQLIDTERGVHLWADRFETDLRNLAQAQSEITGRLARTLNLQLVAAAGQRVDQERAAEPDARDLVMRGRALFQRPWSIATRQEGLQAFERALAIDPESVEARIGIANNLVLNILDSWSTSPAQDAARAEQLLNEALERNAGSAWAHFTMGQLRRWQNRLPESKIELETAIALNRNYSGALIQLGVTLIYLGQPEAAIPLVEKAIHLDPHTPNIQSPLFRFGTLPSPARPCRRGRRPLQEGARCQSTARQYPIRPRVSAWA